MKKIYLFFSFITIQLFLFQYTSNAQNAIPNGSFENWTTAGFELPQNFTGSSNSQAFFRSNSPFNVTKTTNNPYHGNAALVLSTLATATDTLGAFLLNATDADGNPSSWKGGVPYNQKASGIRGYYKYAATNSDSAIVIVVFKHAGITIGQYIYHLGGQHSTYSSFDFTFSPALPFAPDTLLFAVASSNLFVNKGIPGTQLTIDSISFKGVSAQPAMLDGDFEQWQTITLKKANNWVSQNEDGNGVNQSTDSYSGNYAIEMQSYLGKRNGVPRNNAGMLSTGFFDNNCHCQKGGNPYTRQTDTLTLYYKYFPSVLSDSAVVSLSFLKNGNSVGYYSKNLGYSFNYQNIQIPIQLNTSPDTVVVSMQSALWNDSTVSFVGSVLKIDNLAFKSDPIGIKQLQVDQARAYFFPNPFNSSTTLTVDKGIALDNLQIQIFDANGKPVLTKKVTSYSLHFEKSELQSGTYFYQLNPSNGKTLSGKLIVE